MALKWSSQIERDYGLSRANFAVIVRKARELAGEHVDHETGEVNTTALAEAVAYELEFDDWLDDETHPVWDIAVDEAFEYERRQEK